MNLDEDQKKAVEYLDDALVIAGAGSGKTTTIVAKINYLIENNYYKEDEILVISFTNESVNSLKKRVKHQVDIKTFHKLAVDIIDDTNLSVCHESYLDYIINEYFNSYALENKKTKRIIKRLLIDNKPHHLQALIKTFINLYKSNYQDIDYLFSLYCKSWFKTRDYLKIILEVYQIYLRELEGSGMLDFNDLISFATKLINDNQRFTKYKYVIIDEFQDTSLNRFKLIQAILKQNDGKLFAVGDDYQSIYRFSGCDLEIFLNIEHYLPNIKKLFINHNYRNHQSLIAVANKFILRNPKQIKKQTICYKDNSKPIVIHFYSDKTQIFNDVIKQIDGNVLVLGRNNVDKESFNIAEDEQIRFLTIHRSKGLEEDNVVLINLENSRSGFPSLIQNNEILSKVITKDFIIHEEERRLMYVALTRTKNKIHILVPKDNYSVFIKELIWKHKKFVEIKKH